MSALKNADSDRRAKLMSVQLQKIRLNIDQPRLLEKDLMEIAITGFDEAKDKYQFSVHGYVACQPYRIRSSNNKIYLISIRQAVLREDREGCEVVNGSAYEDISQKGKMSNFKSTSSDAKRKSALSGALSTVLTNRNGQAKASFQGERSNEFDEREQQSSKTYTEFARVRRIAGGWRIGLLEGGDPLRGNILDGTYMSDAPWASYNFKQDLTYSEIKYEVSVPIDMFKIDRLPYIGDNADKKSWMKSLMSGEIKKSEGEVLREFFSDLSLRRMIENYLLDNQERATEISLGSCRIIAEIMV